MTNLPNCGCPESPWVQRAQDYIAAHATIPDDAAKVETLRFLLNGHCGLANRVPIDQAVDHLQGLGNRTNREEFQHSILGDLKREGTLATLIYSGGLGGLFIPCDDSEIEGVARQVFARVIGELANLRGMTVHTPRIHQVVDETIQQVQQQSSRILDG